MSDQNDKPLSAADRKELEALRAAQAIREREESGIHVGEVSCGTIGCDFERQPREVRKDVFEVVNKDLGIVENTFTNWVVQGEELCPHCEMALVVHPPNAESAFPKNYRWVYPKPIGA